MWMKIYLLIIYANMRFDFKFATHTHIVYILHIHTHRFVTISKTDSKDLKKLNTLKNLNSRSFFLQEKFSYQG